MFVVTEDTIIAEIMEHAPDCGFIFEENNLWCHVCKNNVTDKIGPSCTGHGADPNVVIPRLNAFIQSMENR